MSCAVTTQSIPQQVIRNGRRGEAARKPIKELELPGQPEIPHVLIHSDPELTRRLYGRMEGEVRPFLIAHRGGSVKLSYGEDQVRTLPIQDLIQQVWHGREGTALEELAQVFDDVRTHFQLGDEPLNVAFVGTHTTACVSIFHRRVAGVGMDSDEPESKAFDWTFSGRSLIGLVDRVLDRVDGIRKVSLADAFPDLRPDPRNSEYDHLARRACEIVKSIMIPPADTSNSKEGLRRPSVPLLFVTEQKGHPEEVDWGPWPEEGPGRRYVETGELIQAFGRERVERPCLRGVLVKVWPINIDEVREQNVLDAPMIGMQTVEQVREAGIEAVVLDARYGIVREDLDPVASSGLIFGFQPDLETQP